MNNDLKLKTTDSRPKTQDVTLLVISHTEHFRNEEGISCGWTPTVREVDFLAGHFKEVIHLAVLHSGMAPASTTPYQALNVRFEHIPPFGGEGLLNKLRIIWVMPLLWFKMHKLLKEVDLFQFRAPTSIGLLIIPLFTLFYRRNRGWYKYAGNWMQPDMPKSYTWQKWMLEKWQKRPVTINGNWPAQPTHVHTFENPCLNEAELSAFRKRGEVKIWQLPYTACFVGRLEDAKGPLRIVELLRQPGIEKSIGTFHFVGYGSQLERYRVMLQDTKVKVVFHGFCSREKTFEIYAESHLMLLPSDSEGFPKVVAEAAAFGCVPVVSDVSSIGQYVNETNGYLWPTTIVFSDFVLQSDLSPQTLVAKSQNMYAMAQLFTFEAFWEKLQKSILISPQHLHLPTSEK